MAGDAAGRAWPSRPRLGLAAAVVVQLLVLYLPRGIAGPSSLPGADKVVHAVVFLLPVLLALLAGLEARVVVAIFAVHAALSEVVQASVLPNRSGDVWDVVADLVGVCCGWLAWLTISRRGSRPPRAGQT
ncbi:MAG: VanZ family protein [Phycicoccus sp.]